MVKTPSARRSKGAATAPQEKKRLSQQLLAFRIDKRNPLPIYLQISDFILALLKDTPVPDGAMLPPERILCENIGISKMTLRQAYSVLIQKGCVEARRGVGTFVLAPRMEKKISGMMSFSEEVRARGGRPSARLLSFKLSKPSEGALQFLRLAPGEQVYEMKRLRFSNKLPLAIEAVELPHRLFPGLDAFNWEHASLYSVIEQHYGFRLSRCSSEIMAVPADREQARLLNLRLASPLLAINRKSHFNDDTPAEFSITYYPGNRYVATFAAVRDVQTSG